MVRDHCDFFVPRACSRFPPVLLSRCCPRSLDLTGGKVGDLNACASQLDHGFTMTDADFYSSKWSKWIRGMLSLGSPDPPRLVTCVAFCFPKNESPSSCRSVGVAHSLAAVAVVESGWPLKNSTHPGPCPWLLVGVPWPLLTRDFALVSWPARHSFSHAARVCNCSHNSGLELRQT